MVAVNLRRFAGAWLMLAVLSACAGSDKSSSSTATSNLSTVDASANGALSLAQATYSATQSSGTVTVTVNRADGSAGVVTVDYATTDGTATAGTEYTSANGTLIWQDGDADPKSFTIVLSNATPFAGTRSFGVSLTNVQGGAFLGTPNTATVTINGDGAVSSSGALAWSATSYSVAQSAGTVTIMANRTGGSVGAVSVTYATADGTAKSGTDYTASSGTLKWADGDSSAKTFTVAVSHATPFTGTRGFTIALSGASGGASLGAPSTAAVTITGSGAVIGPGVIALSESTYSVGQTAGALTVTVTRTSGTVGAVSVAYATADGTAKAGTDYSATSGTLNWANGDASSKSFLVAVSNATAYSGTRSFTIALSSAAGGATLGSPNTATAAITGSLTPACSKTSSSFTTGNAYGGAVYGNYIVNNNDWGGAPNQSMWANSQNCWGFTTSANSERYTISSAPQVERGWSQNGGLMNAAASAAGVTNWTTASGMGIPLPQLTKAKVHWAFTPPAAVYPATRWDALLETDFHKTNNPPASAYYASDQLVVMQYIVDQVMSNGSFYAGWVNKYHGTQITIAGTTYTAYVDNPSQVFNQPGGHTIMMFLGPTNLSTGNNALGVWGQVDAVTDVAALVQFWMQSNPKDDAGNPILYGNGTPIPTPVLTPVLYLNTIQGDFEVDFMPGATNTAFCDAMQNEPDCT